MSRKGVALLVVTALAALLIHACSARQEVEIKPDSVSDAPLDRLVPSPIVLLHGLGGGSQSWIGLRTFLKKKGLRDGGVVRINPNGEPRFTEEAEVRRADLFTLEISDPYQSLDAWTVELKTALEAIHQRTGEARVVLVGHSTGGLVGRKYLVAYPHDHCAAKLVTIASPHRGSDLALLPLALERLRNAVTDGGSISDERINGTLGEIEHSSGIRLDSPILEDLLPEDLNPALSALNGSIHQEDVEYECLRALGGSAFAHWEKLEKVLTGEVSPGEMYWTRFLSDLVVFLRGGNSFQGDGVVSAASQDLRLVDFFRRHPWIRECRGVYVGHSEIKTEYQEILFAITSPLRFLQVYRDGDDSLVVDFHDYFAGFVEIEAYDIRTGNPVNVSPPTVFQRRNSPREVFGRVTIGPFDTRSIDAVAIVARSLDGRRYGRTVVLSPLTKLLPEPKTPEPIVRNLLHP